MTTKPKRITIVALIVVLAGTAVGYSVLFTAGAGTTYETGSGLVVSTTTDHGLSGANPFNGTETVYIDGLSVSASGSASTTVDQFDGTYSNFSQIDATTNTISIVPPDKPQADISGSITDLDYTDPVIDGTTQFIYSASSSGTITLHSLPADTEFAAATKSGETLTTSTTSSAGEATISVTSGTDKHVVLLDPSAPDPQNADASPRNQAKLSTRDIELSIPVNDSDFDTDAGDTVSVDIYVDGSKIDSQTISQNQTVSTTTTISTGGNHSWHIETSDDYGKSATSQTFDFQIPSELSIYNESNPSELLDNGTVDIEFYFESGSQDTIVSRSISDGTVNMTGLPVDQPFVVVADMDGYVPRRIFVPSLYNTQSVYLLPDSKQSVETIFKIEDYTGDYPKDTTVLQIQRNIGGEWKTVEGDYFGANGQFPTQLRYNARHRLVIRNPEADISKVLGTYTPLAAGEQAVTVTSSGEIDVEGGVAISHEPTATQLPSRNSVNISSQIQVSGIELTDFTSTVVYVEDGNRTVLDTKSSSSSTGTTLEHSIDLSNRSSGQIDVEVDYSTSDGESGSSTKTYDISEVRTNEYALLPLVGDFVGLVPSANQDSFTGTTALVMVVVITGSVASIATFPTEVIGLVAIGAIAGFSIIGWLGYDLLFVAIVSWGVISVLRRRY